MERDGYTRQIIKADLVDGNVIRSFETGSEGHPNQARLQSAFSDCLIMGVTGVNRADPKVLTTLEYDNGTVKLARPYAFFSQGTILQGCEVFYVPMARLLGPDSRYCLVIQSTGKAANQSI